MLDKHSISVYTKIYLKNNSIVYIQLLQKYFFYTAHHNLNELRLLYNYISIILYVFSLKITWQIVHINILLLYDKCITI